MSVANTIFSAAKGLVSAPGGSMSATSGEASVGAGMQFGEIAHPDTDISQGSAGPMPDGTLPQVPSASSVTANPSTAAYIATQSAITWADPAAAIAPEYGTAVTPGALPSSTLPATPAMPQQSLMTIDRYAGLTSYAKPALAMGARPALLDVELAAFDVQALAPLDLAMPGYDATAIDAEELVAPDALAYTDDATLIARIKQTLAGSDVFTAAQQDLLYDDLTREQSRDDLRAVRKVMGDMAARGFSMPLGAAQALVADLAYASRQAKQAASLKVRDETFERAKTLLLDALSKAIALETKHFALHISHAGKLVDTLRFNVRMKAELFNGIVRLFNDKAQFVRVVIEAYRDYVRTLEAQDDAIVAEIRARMAKAQTFRAEVEMFSAQAGTLKAFAEVEALGVESQTQALQEYEAYLVGVRANVDVVKRNIEAFRTAIGMMKEVSDVESAKFAAYADQVGAFAAVDDVNAANVSAYAGFWKAENARTGAFSAYIDDSVRALNAEARTFSEYAGAQRSYISALGAKVDAELDNVRTWSSANRSRGAFLGAYNRAQAEVTAAANAQNLANSSIRMMNAALEGQAAAESERIRASLLAADVTAEAALQQAQLAVRSVSVSVRGEADGSQRETTTNTTSNGTQTTYSTVYTTDH